MNHPEREVLTRFLWGTTSREENRRVVRHLLTLCPVCAEALRTPEPVAPAEYDEPLDRFAERVQGLAGAGGAGRRAVSRTSAQAAG